MTRFGQTVNDIKEGKLAGILRLADFKPMTIDKWEQLENALPDSKIIHLDASHCVLDDANQLKLIQLIRKSPQLMVLNVSQNVIDEKVAALMDCINDHPHLENLHINNALTSMGFYLLANKLAKNKTLKSLSIGHGENTLDVEGMKMVMQGLAENTSLLTLNLSNGVMRSGSNEAWSSVGAMLGENNTISELNINNTNMRNHDMQALVAGMKRPESALVHLRLKTCVLFPLNACFDTLYLAIPHSQLIRIEGLDDGMSIYPGINTAEFVIALKKNQAKMQQISATPQSIKSNLVSHQNKKRRHSQIDGDMSAINSSNSAMFTKRQNSLSTALVTNAVYRSLNSSKKVC